MATSKIKNSNILIKDSHTANCTLPANTQGTFSVTKPTQSGYKVLKIMNVWVDGTDTTSPTNFTWIVPVNRWGDTGSPTVQVRNFAPSEAKFTVWASFIMIPE